VAVPRETMPAVTAVDLARPGTTGSTYAGRPAAPPRVPAGYVPEVDALRCIAMTAVIGIHCGLLPIGWMGVWLFFVISGFAVTTSLFSAKHHASGAWSRVGTFYARRAVRIWPIYFLFIAANVVAILVLGDYGTMRQVPWLLTFTQNIEMIIATYAPGTAWDGFGHLWTLSVEQQFYLVFPFLLFLPGRRSQSVILLAMIAAAPLIRYLTAQWAVGHGFDDIHTAFAVYAFGPAQFDAFAIGCLIAMFRQEIAQNKRIAVWAGALAAAITLAYVTTYLIVNLTIIGHLSVGIMRNVLSGIAYGQGREIWGYFVPDALAAAALIGILSGERHLLRLCRLPGLQAIGRISYGGYLYHLPVLMILGALFPPFSARVSGPASYAAHLLLFVCAFAITVGVAWLSFWFIERPISGLARGKLS
jgi:peptidoglycan/LPS O-acetylase OafA/YrhL